jgi:hypothetical protein
MGRPLGLQWRDVMYLWRGRLLSLVFAVLVVGCSGPAAFSDSGVGNGGSAPFELDAGTHRIEYQAVDREPFFGCTVGVAFLEPVADPFAPGRVLAQTDLIRIEPRGQTSGELLTPAIRAGEYSLHYLGDRPCDWTVSVW